jgi:CHAT domain-containing protein
VKSLTAATAVLQQAKSDSKSHPADLAWAAATIDLSAGAVPSRIDAIIDRLAALCDQPHCPAAIRNDLAVALLARAANRQEAIGLFQALDQIERARETDSTASVIAFNEALLLEYLNLYDSAERGWRSVLAKEKDSSWAHEIQRHVARLERARRARPSPEADSSSAREPQDAREWVLNEGLGTWATAAIAGDHARAEQSARRIRDVASDLATRSGDSSVAHVAEVLSDQRPPVLGAIVAFTESAARYRRGDVLQARVPVRDASLRLRSARHDALADWLDVLLMGVDIARSEFAAVEDRSVLIERAARARHDLALVARVQWLRALAESRAGSTANAAADYRTAAALFMQLGEHTSLAAMLSQRGDILFLLGRDDAAIDLKRESLAAFHRRRAAATRVGPLLALGRQLDEVGLEYAGLAVLREATHSAAQSEKKPDLPEALLRLSALELAVGAANRGREALDRARAAMRAVDDSLMRDRLLMEIASVEAIASTSNHPSAAIQQLDSVAGFFRQRGILYDLSTPLARAAQLRLREGDTARAEADLGEALVTVEAVAARDGTPATARVATAARRQVVATQIAIRLARHDTLGAFILAERGRGNRTDRAPKALPGEVVVSYWMLPEETIVWILRDTSMRMIRIPVAEREIDQVAKRFESGMRTTAHGAEWETAARWLYDHLLAPAQADLTRASVLRVVADGIIGRIPFAALMDRENRYVVEKIPIVYSLTVRPREPQLQIRGPLLVVGNPAFNPREFPELPDLPAASVEAREIRTLYKQATVLEGAGATKSAFVAALSGAGVVHFAGHARLVERAPSLSHLVFARDVGDNASTILTASEIERLKLRGIGTVVLSACGTTQTGNTRDNSQSGLARSFLDAGVGAVVSSLWEVDDRSSAMLMTRLHQRLAAGDAAPTALRAAQRSLLDSLRAAPSVWGAYRLDR